MSQQLHFLLIDDDRKQATHTEKLLKTVGNSLQLEWVADLDRGLERVEKGDLDGILLRISDNVPRAAIAQLRGANRTIPIVVSVTQNQMEAAAESLRQGAQEFIIEEFLTAERLLEAAKYAVDVMKNRVALEAANEQFRESDLRMRAVLNASLDCIITLDTKGHILEFNPAAENTFGYTSDELVGRKATQLFDSSRKKTFPIDALQQYQQYGENPEIGRRIEIKALRKDRTDFPAELAVHPVPLEGEPMFTIFLRDITARRNAEEGQKQYAAELERSNRDLEQYVSIVSHDLTTPLRAITGFCQLLQIDHHTHFDKKAQECLTFIVEGARRMRALIDDLRTYSKVTTKQKPIECVACQEILKDSMNNLELEILEVQPEIITDNLPEIMADKTQMVQLFQNLIGNAIKYRSERDLQIHVLAERVNCEWVFTIRDNGIGFNPEETDKIFEIFQRLHVDEDQYSGTGIGLAICKRIVERHQGRIWAQSVPREGSSFIFTLPVVPEERVTER